MVGVGVDNGGGGGFRGYSEERVVVGYWEN